MPKILLLATLVAMIAPPLTALAKPVQAPASSSPPTALKYLTQKGLKVNSRFSTPGHLTGYVGTVPGGKQVVFFIPKDGSVAIFGTMVDAYGHDLSQAYLHHYQRGPGAARSYHNLESRHWIAEGAKQPKRIVYMFIDPNCPYCWMLWKEAQKYYKQGLQARYIIVAILGGTSPGKAAAILTAKDPGKALRKNESGFAHHSGAIRPLDKIPDKLQAKISENNALFLHFGFNGTPAMVWKDSAGNVKTADGLPQGETLAEIFDLDEAGRSR